jgi:hypothetical protein
LLDTHFLEDLAGKFLEFADLDGASFEPVGVACGGAELADGTESSAGEAEGVVGEDDLGGPVIVLVLNLIDEGADVDAHRAGLLAGAVRALHAPHGLAHGLLLRVDPVMEGTGPVVPQIPGRDPLVLDAVALAVGLASVGVDDLRRVELGGSGEHLA